MNRELIIYDAAGKDKWQINNNLFYFNKHRPKCVLMILYWNFYIKKRMDVAI